MFRRNDFNGKITEGGVFIAKMYSYFPFDHRALCYCFHWR